MRNILERLRQKHRTIPYPLELPVLPDRFRGMPAVDASKCPDGCRACAGACPTGAITSNGSLAIDLGMCLFCTDCI
jgi:formate hydrogenlyase subunit 6/NADH:ubiquinone oxidoreductase subunit I